MGNGKGDAYCMVLDWGQHTEGNTRWKLALGSIIAQYTYIERVAKVGVLGVEALSMRLVVIG